ncbi:N-carbamoylputrescine amidase, partial [Escherichia coli]|nr:N-carbamoylputrescine amidase [Escherichia coli]
MTEITVAALQLAFSNDIDANIKHVSRLVREAASRG